MYAPPAVELPNTRQIVGIRDCERRVRSRNPRPPATKIFDWLGRSAPADSIIEIDGSRLCSAMSLSRPDFQADISLIAPPFTVDSLAVIRHSTPDTRPMPPTIPAPGVWPGTSLPASGHSSRKYLSLIHI